MAKSSITLLETIASRPAATISIGWRMRIAKLGSLRVRMARKAASHQVMVGPPSPSAGSAPKSRRCAHSAPDRWWNVAGKGAQIEHAGIAARNVHSAEAAEAQDPQQGAGKPRRLHECDPQHRRRENDAVEPALAAGDGANHNGRAHGMSEREIRRRTIRQHHLAHEHFEVEIELGEIAHIALVAVAERALRQPLPAPIQDGDGKAAAAQIADRLEIFFDPFGAARENADRAAAAGRRRKARKADLHAVRGLEHAADGAFGNRIGGN